MKRAAPWLLLVTGILLILSAGAHAFLGWPMLRGELQKSRVDDGLIQGVGIGWLYGSAAMLTFGALVLTAWWWTRTGRIVAATVSALISLLYLGFGTWALLESGFEPHFIGFVVIGLLLGLASLGLRGLGHPS